MYAMRRHKAWRCVFYIMEQPRVRLAKLIRLGGSWAPGVVGAASPAGNNEHPIRSKKLRIRPRGYLFMLRSILMLPGFKIPIKSEKMIDF